MKSLLAAACAFSVVVSAATVLAQEEPAPKPAPRLEAKKTDAQVTAKAVLIPTADLDDAYYKAFYAENGLRDFEKAAALYEALGAEAAKGDRKDLAVKCALGRARCLRTLGKADAATAAARFALALDAENAEAKGIVAALAGGGAGTEGLDERIQTIVGWMEKGATEEYARELLFAGDRAVPFLAKSLRKRDLTAVQSAAGYLAFHFTPAMRAALLDAMRDPGTAYPVAVAEAVCHPQFSEYRNFTDPELPLLEEVAGRPETALRLKVIGRLDNDSSRPPSILPLLLRLARDPEVEVRAAALNVRWPSGILRALEPAVRAALASKDPGERAAAAGACGRDADLLRALQGEVRALLKDEAGGVRLQAFEALQKNDGLSQEDLAGLLGDADGVLVGQAAAVLAKVPSWDEVAGAAIRRAIGKALRAEIPAEGIECVIYLAFVDGRVGGLTPEEKIDLLGFAWTRECRLGAQATAGFRKAIMDDFQRWWQAYGMQPGHDAWVLRGVENIPAADGLVEWLSFWNGKARAKEAFLLACRHPDGRVRAYGYGGVARGQDRRNDNEESVRDRFPLAGPLAETFPHLAEDLGAADGFLRGAALELANCVPDPSLAAPLRALHTRAAGEERARLLEVLVRAAGKDAMGAVREDLGSPDPAVRSEALGRLVISLGVEDPEELKGYLAKGGLPAEVAHLWSNLWAPPPSVDLLRAFVKMLSPAQIDDEVLYQVRLLTPIERWTYLSRALESANPSLRQNSAYKAAEWRTVEAIPVLTRLLDDAEHGVREAAKYSLQQLREYIELKASAARIGHGVPENTLGMAEAMLQDKDPLKRRGGVLALAALGDKSAIPVLLRALDDPDKGVRDAALGALERLGGKPAAEEPPR